MLHLHCLRAATALLAVCVTLAGPAAQADDIEPGIMKGRATDARGQPLAGAQVFADNQYFDHTILSTATDGDGRYRLDVSRPVGTYGASAMIASEYNGRIYQFELDPLPDEIFAGNEGALRDFVWKLTGLRPDGGFYGSSVVLYVDLRDFMDIQVDSVALTLEPVGPLVDGSSGKTIDGFAESTGDGNALTDVPVGRYRITARYEPEGEKAQLLLLRLRDKGDYVPTLVADFEPVLEGYQRLELEVQLAP